MTMDCAFRNDLFRALSRCKRGTAVSCSFEQSNHWSVLDDVITRHTTAGDMSAEKQTRVSCKP